MSHVKRVALAGVIAVVVIALVMQNDDSPTVTPQDGVWTYADAGFPMAVPAAWEPTNWANVGGVPGACGGEMRSLALLSPVRPLPRPSSPIAE